MLKQSKARTPCFSCVAAIAAAMLFFFTVSCGNHQTGQTGDGKSVVRVIQDEQEFKSIIESSGDRPLLLYFYADWCPPCKQLSPMLEEIAREHTEKASFYKINIDRNQFLAQSFQVTGVPYVVFVVDKTLVQAVPGLHKKSTYVKLIDHFSNNTRKTGSIASFQSAVAYPPAAPPEG